MCAIAASLALPAFVFSLLYVIYLSYWLQNSPVAVQFWKTIIIVATYIILSIPNTWVGAFIGFK